MPPRGLPQAHFITGDITYSPRPERPILQARLISQTEMLPESLLLRLRFTTVGRMRRRIRQARAAIPASRPTRVKVTATGRTAPCRCSHSLRWDLPLPKSWAHQDNVAHENKGYGKRRIAKESGVPHECNHHHGDHPGSNQHESQILEIHACKSSKEDRALRPRFRHAPHEDRPFARLRTQA